jgi:hypothetical protein
MSSDHASIPQSLEEVRESLARLQAAGRKLESTAKEYQLKMRRSRRWNYLAIAMAVVVCIVAWANQASPWLRWGVLPVVLFMVLFLEAMRRLLGLTMQSSLRQLKQQIGGLEARLAAHPEARPKEEQP